MKKIAVFVDVQNIYYTVKDTFGCNFNYRKLWDKLSADGEIVVANAYAIDRNDPQQRGFQKALGPKMPPRWPQLAHLLKEKPKRGTGLLWAALSCSGLL